MIKFRVPGVDDVQPVDVTLELDEDGDPNLLVGGVKILYISSRSGRVVLYGGYREDKVSLGLDVQVSGTIKTGA